jgi:hypothetical protein
VNLVSIFNISQVFTVSEKYLECRAVHDILGFAECECVFPWSSAKDRVRCVNQTWPSAAFAVLMFNEFFFGALQRKEVDELAEHYRQRMAKVAAKTPQTNDFALVLQPMFSDFRIPDISFLSRLDCFHPDVKAHQQMVCVMIIELSWCLICC